MKKLLALLVLAVAAVRAPAETVSAECVALGWQTQNAAEVFVGTAESETGGASGPRSVTLRVEDSLKGSLAADATATVVVPGRGEEKPWALRARFLCFAVPEPARAGEPQRFRLVSGAFGLRPVGADGPEARFPGIVRDIAATLAADGRVRDAEKLRTLLVAWMEDADPGVAWSAATDFVRLEELHAGLTAAERGRIVGAYSKCPIGKSTKEALAFAVAAARDPSASKALVATLMEPNARLVRGAVAESLRRLADPETETSLDRELLSAGAPERRSLLVALGQVGTDASVPAARRSLADDVPEVRAEAAHALGLIARNVREKDAAARVTGVEDLVQLVRTAKTAGESRAALWALAQLDDTDAWKALRAVAGDETADASLRKAAEDYVKRPRVSLVLE